MSGVQNLGVTLVSGAMSSTIGAILDALQSAIGNGGRDRNCKFYYSAGTGGSILQVMVKKGLNMATGALKDAAVNEFNSILNGKKKSSLTSDSSEWGKFASKEKQENEEKQYGRIQVDGGTVYALDDWGGISPDALMLAIETDKEVTITQTFPIYGQYAALPADVNNAVSSSGMYKYGNDTYRKPTQISNRVTGKNIVWYDTTALITINSDKNVVVTKVQGRDYSRKELVSNGDIKFSVSGQITSGIPDIYPAEEIQKFIKIMQYKGIVKINNQVLDQFGIENILITDFNITPKEGYKSLQNYTFNAIGLQPESEKEITEDTVEIESVADVKTNEDNAWKNMLDNQLDGLKSTIKNLGSQGAALFTGEIENLLNKTL